VEGFERGGCEGRFASGAGFPDRAAGVAETIAHLCRPGLAVERDERLEFAQVMSVQSAWAEGCAALSSLR
jgi:hypothetical protein